MGIFIFFLVMGILLVILELFFGCGGQDLPRYDENDPEDYF